MNILNVIDLIKFPEKIQKGDLQHLDKLCEEYPYCSLVHKLRLKGLRTYSSDQYNNALKLAAAISGNRTMLFDFITESPFIVIKEKAQISKKTNLKSETTSKSLEFKNTDMHSFSEWLKLSTLQPIIRIEKSKSNTLVKKITRISDFIENNKKKKTSKKEFFSPTQMAEESLAENNHLMTETLAKVYIDQGHYQKAIIAYEILILKYPQKSGLFADQIKAIKLINS